MKKIRLRRRKGRRRAARRVKAFLDFICNIPVPYELFAKRTTADIIAEWKLDP